MDSDRIAAEFFLNRTSGQFALASAVIRAISGLVFLYFGLTKLTDLSGTTSQFYYMGFPNSSTIPLLVGLLETFGGLALVAGLVTRLAAGLLALDMAGACLATLRIMDGRAVFLLLPLLMLVLMAYVLWAGPAAYALDDRFAVWLAIRFKLATGADVSGAAANPVNDAVAQAATDPGVSMAAVPPLRVTQRPGPQQRPVARNPHPAPGSPAQHPAAQFPAQHPTGQAPTAQYPNAQAPNAQQPPAQAPNPPGPHPQQPPIPPRSSQRGDDPADQRRATSGPGAPQRGEQWSGEQWDGKQWDGEQWSGDQQPGEQRSGRQNVGDQWNEATGRRHEASGQHQSVAEPGGRQRRAAEPGRAAEQQRAAEPRRSAEQQPRRSTHRSEQDHPQGAGDPLPRRRGAEAPRRRSVGQPAPRSSSSSPAHQAPEALDGEHSGQWPSAETPPSRSAERRGAGAPRPDLAQQATPPQPRHSRESDH